jgi:hypothetical protein
MSYKSLKNKISNWWRETLSFLLFWVAKKFESFAEGYEFWVLHNKYCMYWDNKTAFDWDTKHNLSEVLYIAITVIVLFISLFIYVCGYSHWKKERILYMLSENANNY